MKTIESLSKEEKKKIREAVEEELERYRFYKSFILFESESDGSSTIYTPEQKAEIASFCKRIEQAVNSLPEKEKFLITEKYLNQECEYITDMDMYNNRFNPPISPPLYSEYRERAMFKIAFLIGGIELLIKYQHRKIWKDCFVYSKPRYMKI